MTERKAKQISMLEHAMKKAMWAGSQKLQTIEYYVLDYDEEKNAIFTLKELKYPPALLKIIDEVIVNASDHHTHYPKLVTKIDISLSPNGTITIRNNGPGIPVVENVNLNGVKMYTPQLIATEFLAGDNLDDDGSNTKGGTNGVGLKLAAGFSDSMILETLDATRGLLYNQVYENGLKDIHEPVISKVGSKVGNSTHTPYTQIIFKPNYERFKLDINKFYTTLLELIRTRAWQIAAYTKAKVSFNGETINTTFLNFCQMFTENLVYSTTMERNSGKHPWEVCFAVSEGKSQSVSIVNGVNIPKGGTHIEYIQKLLVTNLKTNVEKQIKKSGVKFNKNYILNNVFIFMKGEIPSPDFLSQTKEAISDPIEKFAGYDLSPSEWKKVWELLEDAIMSSFLKKQLGEVKTRANRGKVDVPKYKEARLCRDAKKCHQCGLIVTEGDSASGTADTGLLSDASPNFNYDYFGIYGIQGVMINCLKESTDEIKSKKSKSKDDADIPKKRGKKDEAINKKVCKSKAATDDISIMITSKRVPNNKLLSNERISSLIKVLGLDFRKSYALTDIGDKEWKTLRYGYMVGLTDQDLDGFNIFGLLCTFIATYWPNLVKRDFLRRIITPVIRAYPKNKKEVIKQFYSEREFYEWSESLTEKQRAKYTIKYYKGLGSHNQRFKEITEMFKDIDKKICTYELDNEALKNMYIYYGPDTEPRKVALSTRVDENVVDVVSGGNISGGAVSGIVSKSKVSTKKLSKPLSLHYSIDCKLYQRDNIIRKLLNAIDGFVASRRKVFFVARKNGHKEIKVQGLAAMAVAEANYHHGEASLEQTIVRMAQGYPMGRNLPLLQPNGNFGSRAKGYKDAAASRYIYTVINWRLADKLFRKEDEFILDYEVDDGTRYEPKYYVPIIPYVLCETNELPATGWAISTHARDIKAIFKNLRQMITGKIKNCAKLPMWNKDFKGKVKKYKSRNYFVGEYEYNEKENTVRITELPVGIFSDAYINGSDSGKIKKTKSAKTETKKVDKGIKSKDLIDDIEDNTKLDTVDITIYLKQGAYDAISADDSGYGNEVFDCFEDYFQLKRPVYDRINLINDKAEVVEYKTYEEVFDDWYIFRKNLYVIRIEREIILTNLKIKLLMNMQRFSREHDSYNITNKTDENTVIEILTKNKYEIFNHVLLENPKYTTVKELKNMITNPNHGASYEYLLKVSYRDLTKTQYEKRADEIEKLKNRLVDLSDETGLFIGAKIWLKEIDELEAAIEEGLATEWSYGENEVNFG
jgi:DNA topoisomerase-2